MTPDYFELKVDEPLVIYEYISENDKQNCSKCDEILS